LVNQEKIKDVKILMNCGGSIRLAALFLSILAIPFLLFRGLVAPFLLLIGIVWMVTSIFLIFKNKRLDNICFMVSAVSLGALIGIYFIPLWVAELTAKTPAEYLWLADKLKNRGQLMGNRTKAQAYYLKAAEGGNAIAQARVGEAFFFGHYGVTNRDDGIKWLKKAAANGHQSSRQLLESIEP
jgi:hypothetical protein